MNKKIAAALMTGVLSVACAFGFTACGENDEVKVPKGQAVTEAEWKTAMEASAKAENYTCEQEQTTTITAKYKDENGDEVNESFNTTITIKEYLGNTGYYNEQITKKTDDENSESKMLMYYVIEGKTLWYCQYEEETGDSEAEQEKPEWKAYADVEEVPEGGKMSDYQGSLHYMFEAEFATSADGEEATLADLYSAFSYKDGKYSANLISKQMGAISLSISIKDGYVVGYESSFVYEESYGEASMKTEYAVTAVIKNYGSTTPAAPAEATAAINKVKAEQAD